MNHITRQGGMLQHAGVESSAGRSCQFLTGDWAERLEVRYRFPSSEIGTSTTLASCEVAGASGAPTPARRRGRRSPFVPVAQRGLLWVGRQLAANEDDGPRARLRSEFRWKWFAAGDQERVAFYFSCVCSQHDVAPFTLLS